MICKSLKIIQIAARFTSAVGAVCAICKKIRRACSYALHVPLFYHCFATTCTGDGPVGITNERRNCP